MKERDALQTGRGCFSTCFFYSVVGSGTKRRLRPRLPFASVLDGSVGRRSSLSLPEVVLDSEM